MTILACRWCGMLHGAGCPSVKAIEFYADGITIKRVEFKTANDYPVTYPTWHFQVPQVPCSTGGGTNAATAKWADGMAFDPSGRARC